MVRHFRSVRRNNRKRLTRRMRGGTQQPPQSSPSFFGKARSVANSLTPSNLLSGANQLFGPFKEKALTSISSAQDSLEEGAKDVALKALLKLREKYPELYDGVALFNSFDENKDGSIDKNEFNKLMKTVGLTNDITNNILFDYIASTKIGPKEFSEYYPMIKTFKQLDKDDDGSISRQEFVDAFPEQTKQFETCDTNSDGSLNIAEFITCMYPKRLASAQGGRSSSRKYKYTNKLRNSRRSRSY
jgi:Ca2+-binding EF-hand superfamily protein